MGASARVVEKQEQRMVAGFPAGSTIRCGEDRIHLGFLKVRQRALCRLLERDRRQLSPAKGRVTLPISVG